MVVGAWRIRNEKLRKYQYREGYARSLEGKGVQWDGDDNVECRTYVGGGKTGNGGK